MTPELPISICKLVQPAKTMDSQTCIVNTFRKEYFIPADLLPEGLGWHALAVLLREQDDWLEGRWAGEPLYLIDGASHDTALHRATGDSSLTEFSALDLLKINHLDLTPLLIAYFRLETHRREDLVTVADSEPDLWLKLLGIPNALDTHPLRDAILERQPPNWQERYNQLFFRQTSTCRVEQVRQIDSRQPKPPLLEITLQEQQRRQRREQEPELAHTIEIIKIEGTHVTANLQACPPDLLDGTTIKHGLTGIACYGKMHFPDALFVLRALLSAWNNLSSGIHFTSLAVSTSEAKVLRKQATQYATLKKLSTALLRHPISFSQALPTARHLDQHSWVGKPYLSTSCAGVQISLNRWQAFLTLQQEIREYFPAVQVSLAEQWWDIPKADEIVHLEFTVQDPALIDFLRVGMRWRFFASATLCPHCGAVESGKFINERSEYEQTYEDKYEERGVVFRIFDYKCNVCRRTWNEALTFNYRDSSCP